jgi:hypothetical protein
MLRHFILRYAANSLGRRSAGSVTRYSQSLSILRSSPFAMLLRSLRTILWPSAVLFLWAGAGRACLADGASITGGIEPAYTACLSAGSSCSSFARTQFRLQYKPFARRGFSVRIKVARAYQLTLDDDKDDGSSEEQQASKFDPPFDVVDVKFRFSEADGRDRFELRTGYAYQHSDPNTDDGYHAAYLSGDYYFGPAMQSGWGGLSRRFDVLLRVSGNQYVTLQRPDEEFGQFVSTYTLPISNDGTTRIYTSYARELRFGGSNTVRTPSNRFDLGAVRNPTRWLELFGRFSVFGTRGVPATSRVVVGVDVTI